MDPTSLDFRALSHADQVEVLDVSFPPRLVNTLEWRIQSEYAGEVQVEMQRAIEERWHPDLVLIHGPEVPRHRRRVPRLRGPDGRQPRADRSAQGEARRT